MDPCTNPKGHKCQLVDMSAQMPPPPAGTPNDYDLHYDRGRRRVVGHLAICKVCLQQEVLMLPDNVEIH